jgi:hypothetical protein
MLRPPPPITLYLNWLPFKVPQRTYIPRVPQFLSSRPNWDPSPPPLSQASMSPPRNQRRGGHTRLRVRGWGSPNSDDYSVETTLGPALLQSKFGREHFLPVCLQRILWPHSASFHPETGRKGDLHDLRQNLYEFQKEIRDG